MRAAIGCMGIRGPRDTYFRLRSGMARSTLFFWPDWLGAFERATKSKHTGERSVAKQPHCALSTRESPTLADPEPRHFGDGTFCHRPNSVRHTHRWRSTLLQRTGAPQRATTF